jgi:hypothetical protein
MPEKIVANEITRSSEVCYATWQPQICTKYPSLRVEKEDQEVYFLSYPGAINGILLSISFQGRSRH